jgi:hypothetical protein
MDKPHPFGLELRRLRERRKLSLRQMGRLVNFTPGYLSKIENGRAPTVSLARLCDEALLANGRLVRLARVSAEPAHPDQLPPVVGRSAGRKEELGHLTAMLRRRVPGPLIAVVDGSPGVGKSTLAIRAAHQVTDDFPDGVLYADLRGASPDEPPLQPGEVLSAFLFALGAPVSPGSGVDAQSALYRSVLSGRRALVVLDNATSSTQVKPLLPGGSECTVLVTSRQRLAELVLMVDAERVTLAPLDGPASIALFHHVLGEERVNADRDAFDELARLCGHLPIALRIAAERVAARHDRPVRHLLDQLRTRPLDALETEGTVGIRDVLEPSYRRLDVASARLFRLIGLHPGADVTTSTAAALAGVPCAEAERRLDRLSAAHLVETHGERYRLPPLIAHYAAEQATLTETPEHRQAAIDRLAASYLTAATAALDTPARVSPAASCCAVHPVPEASRWYATEAANIEALVRLLRGRGRDDLAAALRDRLYALCPAAGRR